MLLDLSLLFFVLLGSKIVLGAVAIYMLLSRDATCVICDAETLPIEHPRGTQLLLRVLRLQWRWCMECQRGSLTRTVTLPVTQRKTVLPVAEPRVR
jgi:hypothetical protein